MRGRVAAALGALVVVGMAAGPARAEQDAEERCPDVARPHRDKVVARVGATKITVCDVTESLGKMSPYLRKAYAEPEKLRHFLDNMVRFELIAAEAVRRGYGDDPEVLRVEKQMLVQRLYKEIQSGVALSSISETEMRAYYDAHRDEYVKAETVRIARILCATEADCESVLAKAAAKATDSRYFRSLARDLSIDAATRDHGGDLPYVPRAEDRTDEDPEVATALVNAAFTLDMSDPLYRGVIKTDDGWNVIRLRGRRKARKLDFADVKRQIRHRLHRDHLAEAREELLRKLRKSTRVRLFPKALATVHIDPASSGGSGSAGAAPPRSGSDEARRRAPVARVGATVITVGDYEDRLNKQGPFRRAEYGTLEKRREFLDSMVDWELQAQEARRRGFQRDEAVRGQVKRVMSSILLRREVDDRVTPDDVEEAELRAYYSEHISTFRRPERVRAYHILVSDRAKAQALLDRIRRQAVDTREFRRLARETSEDPVTKRRGGDLRYFTKVADRAEGDPEVPEPIVRATFELLRRRTEALERASAFGPDAGSGASVPGFDPIYPRLVKTAKGYNIVRFMGHREAVDRSFDEVERQIRNRVWREKLQKAREDFIAALRSRHRVKVSEEHLAHVVVSSAP